MNVTVNIPGAVKATATTGVASVTASARATGIRTVYKYNFLFVVKGRTGLPIAGAVVTLGSQQVTTGVNGYADFNCDPGTYSYTITKDNYVTQSGSVTFTGSSSLAVTLLLTVEQYAVLITVAYTGIPIADAVVAIGEDEYVTDDNGQVSLQLPAGTYTYMAAYDGYYIEVGDFTISNTDLNLAIPLTLIPDPPTSRSYNDTLSFAASETYIKTTIGGNYGTWTFGALTNVASYFTSINGGAWSTSPATITLAANDVLEVYITKTTGGQTASIAVSGTYSFTTAYTQNSGGTLTYIDSWMLLMLSTYQETHDNQLDSADMIEEFLNRLQPHYVLKNRDGSTASTGWAYTTFGPNGLNRQTCDFVVIFRFLDKVDVLGSNYIRINNSTRVNIDGYLSTKYGSNFCDSYYKGENITFYISFYGASVLAGTVNLFSYQKIHCKLPKFNDNTGLWIQNAPLYGRLLYTPLCNVTSVYYILNSRLSGKFIPPASTVNNGMSLIYNNFSSVDSAKWSFIPATLTSITFNLNSFPTAEIDKILNNIRLRIDEITPTANCTYGFTGQLMGAPTGGANNTDILAIQAKYAAAGKTATFNIN